ncbi:MAG: glycosyltransferase family 4 protein [Sutterellaceae bacterium]|nr:glycosyltransferase family 4 protein [Burkholderiaceae bacterium]MDW8430299.1 glycosyltransferase family 4 protein [Sutterellaceae bacterium]
MPARNTVATRAGRRDDAPTWTVRVLSVTTLYPSAVAPRHGIFVETRLRQLLALGGIDVRVAAPVPWFPFAGKAFGRFGMYAATPAREERWGILVYHPRYLSLPHIADALRLRSLAAAYARVAAELLEGGWDCDVVDAHYLYPDGVAAAHFAQRLGRPLVLTARGSDVNYFGWLPTPRRHILAALVQARRVITVSHALRDALIAIGASPTGIEVLRNGVDVALFRPGGGPEVRARLGLGSEPLVLSVGNLVPEKGHLLVLEAVARLAGVHLLVVGEGPLRRQLAARAERLGVAARVHLHPNVPQTELARIYSAADVLVLASTREGCPNVLLEALACGTPVVTSDVGGAREIVTDGVVGHVVSERTAEAFAAAIDRTLTRDFDPAELRRYAEHFSWKPIVQRYRQILAEAASDRQDG